mgnify:CR=1 FL=1
MDQDRDVFQEWIEEFIYQFSKAVRQAKEDDPLTAFLNLQKSLEFISSYNLDTSKIRGLQNKAEFDHSVKLASLLLKKLKSDEAVQKFIDSNLKNSEDLQRRVTNMEVYWRDHETNFASQFSSEHESFDHMLKSWVRYVLKRQKGEVFSDAIDYVGKTLIVEALEITGGNRSKASQLLSRGCSEFCVS